MDKVNVASPIEDKQIKSNAEEGPWQGIVYAVIVLIVLVCVVIAILTLLGPTIGNVFSTVGPGGI